MQLPVRKVNRLQGFDYNSYGSYFITICVKERHAILSNIIPSIQTHGTLGTASPTISLTEYGLIVEEVLHSVGDNNVNAFIDRYVIMPDHVHFILTIVGGAVPSAPQNEPIVAPQTQMVPRIIKWFKRITNQKIGFAIWQRSYHSQGRQIRFSWHSCPRHSRAAGRSRASAPFRS